MNNNQVNIVEFISWLHNQGINISTNGEKLLCRVNKGTLTPALRQQIAERQAEIIVFLQQTGQGYNTNYPPIKAIPRDQKLPLSFSQERLWFIDKIEGSKAPYIEHGALQITGNLNVLVLEQALSEIVFRHEVLRTSFPTLNGTPTQVIHPDSTININVVDLQQYPEPERETVLQQQVQFEATTPFDLEVAPLIRCKLWQLDTSEYVLVLTMHHIVSDGWSMGILIEELSSLYQAFCVGAPSPLAELLIQYADFALWQRQWLSGEILETQLNYWKEALLGAPELLQLPTDRPRPHVMSYRGSSESFSLSTELTEKLQQLSVNAGSTLFMTLQAAFATLLYRYSGQFDILIGSPIANRNRREIDSLIGFFVNTLVLRTRFEDNPSFEKLLRQVRETTLIAYEHQDVPFEQVVEALQPQRSLSHAPLFQVMFVLQNTPMGTLDLPGLSLSQLNQHSTIAKFDLTLSMTETEIGLVGIWEYNTDLFDRSTIKRMATHFQNLLSAIVDNPQLRVGEFPLLSEGERHQLLVEWNDTASDYPKEKCIHQLVEEQVEKTPDAIAVVFNQEQLTYHQLNQRANQLAHHLQNLGVGPEVLVGICVERSVQMVVGLLGILKAGGAYVPLDPNYPPERLSYMLADSGVEVLLTQQSLVESLPKNQAQVVCLDSDWGAIEQYSGENLEVGVSSDNLAYVIYTSGSTGQPKGVAMNHSPLVNLILWQLKNSSAKYSTKTGQFTPISFDVSFQEILSTWCSGGTLVLIPEDVRRDGTALLQLLKQQGVERLFLPFVALEHLATSALTSPECLPSTLCELITAGEQLQITPTLAKFFEKLSNCRLENQYGPTETHVVSAFTLNGFPSNWSSLPPIGRPIANTQIYILDKHLQPVPIGVPGELYLGGDGLARGYLNRRELTKQKFIQNPFCSSNTERLYKTSDLARYLPEGNIEFIGRIDNQVKIRGFRIELGEIEAVLSTHPHIQQTTVIVREDSPGNKRLVAYYVSQSESLTTNQLREFLKQKLPDYMVPSAFITLETLPLTPNGKVDRNALPAPEGEISRVEEYVAPRTPTEEIIANIFALVLGVQDVGIHDNFFELGGHSLLATQLISQLRVTFNIEIPLREVFKTPTIALIEPKLTQLLTTDNQLRLPLIQPRTDSEQLPLSWAQERLWFLNQLEGSSATYNMPAALKITGNLIINALEQTLSEIINRHEVLRTSFSTINGTPIQVIHPDTTINIDVVDLQKHPKQEQETILQQEVQQEATTPFDLEVAPLIRCKLWQLDTSEYVLVLTMHHIVSDGWSMGILIEELSRLYQAFAASEASPLPELAIQYADFALWQRQWLSGEILENQLNYWKQELEGAPELLQLATDYPRPTVATYQGRTESFSLNTELTQKLQTLSRDSGTTLFMTLLAAFGTLLHRYSGQEDILIGTPIANRNRREIEPLIGFFVNTLVIRTDLSGNPSFRELLRRVRSVSLDAYAHQDVPFEQLVKQLQPERSLSYNPLFQVFFNMLNFEETQLELPGIKIEKVDINETGNSKFYFTLYAAEKNKKIQLKLVYNAELFLQERIRLWLNQFHHLITQIVAYPNYPISSYSLVTPESKHLLPDPKAVLPQPEYELVTTMFTSWAKRTPAQPAICQGFRTWNYGELSQTAQTLGKVLLAHGIKRGEVVAVSGVRSFGLIASIIGVFLSGGVLLSVDPKLPNPRQLLMLHQAKAKYIIYVGTQPPDEESIWNSLVNISVEPETAEVINSQKDISQITHLPEIVSDHAAYIFFTSGSTGVPKGVLGSHQGISHFLTWQRQRFEIGQQDRIAQLTGLSFDAVLRDIFLPLTSGAILCLPQEEDILEPTLILSWLETEQISVLHTVPTLAQSWLTNVPPGVSLSSLRWLFFAGEPLKGTLVRQWREVFPQAGEIVNLYGATETTLVKCCYQVPNQPSSGIESAGWPLPETQALVLGENNQLCGIGEEGEIVIRTPFCSLGYINASQENLSRFVKNPFRNDPQDLFYYTGDRGRYDLDGSLEILGRFDHQVKIRGVRIEPGEIETVLSQHQAVLQTVVIATEDIAGNKRLIAYVVTSDQSLTSFQLREFLFSKLPSYMVPSAFVTLDSLPLTPNGKVDRKSLPAPDGFFTRENEYVAPRTTIELELTQIWSEVLNLTSVGVQDNFFELGGHSLNAVSLMSKIQQQFQINLPLATLFKSPTIEQLASLLGSSVNTQNPILVGIKTSGNQPPLFCIHPVGGNVLCYAELARHLAQDYPVYGLQSLGLDGQQQPLTSVEEMASDYIEAIQQIQPQGPYHLIGWSMGGVIAYEMAQQLQAKNTPVALLTLIDSYAPTLIRKPSEIDQAMIVNQLAQDLGGLYGQELDISHETLRQIEPDEQVLHLFEQGKQQGILPSDLEIEQMRSLWKVLKANITANYHYKPKAYPGSLLLINASQTSPAVIEDPTHGWGSLVNGDIQTHTITGDHYTIMKAPQVDGITAELNNYLLNN
ncbi:non-ribosomal peptide synthetase [Moorena producens PAL-8-15-08-1]|uniref:Non-ribosomal peptide synthetase n=1 Tax=Moorena producens PAL-8-15-08-1 TaxID=1458985 RepID=A0A1D8TYR5_9CYAN|nr:non-ribosomal peptide synthetase [Moorena producens]AOX02683.1 non-ribosomal peptide synthetase [Moorena producens PAL-8-15-08-1]